MGRRGGPIDSILPDCVCVYQSTLGARDLLTLHSCVACSPLAATESFWFNASIILHFVLNGSRPLPLLFFLLLLVRPFQMGSLGLYSVQATVYTTPLDLLCVFCSSPLGGAQHSEGRCPLHIRLGGNDAPSQRESGSFFFFFFLCRTTPGFTIRDRATE